jgi:hypothetical protein
MHSIRKENLSVLSEAFFIRDLVERNIFPIKLLILWLSYFSHKKRKIFLMMWKIFFHHRILINFDNNFTAKHYSCIMQREHAEIMHKQHLMYIL